MDKKIVPCTKVIVDCVQNDKEDIKCGGPAFLGFDFYVESEKLAEMKKFIVETLFAFDVPVSNIYSAEDVYLEEKDVWNMATILKAISDDAEYLQMEAFYRRHK